MTHKTLAIVYKDKKTGKIYLGKLILGDQNLAEKTLAEMGNKEDYFIKEVETW